MTTNASYVFSQIRALLDDQEEDFATDAYLLPFLQGAQDDLVVVALNNPELGSLSSVVVIPNVTEGTTSLAAYFTEGSSLSLMTDVISMKERSAGGSRKDIDWIWMYRSRDLPTIAPTAFNIYFQFDGRTINLPGADQNLDFRVFGKFSPAKLKDGETPIVPGTEAILKYWAASNVAASRGNTNLADRYERKGDNAKESYIADAIMEMQNVRARMRSYSGRVRDRG